MHKQHFPKGSEIKGDWSYRPVRVIYKNYLQGDELKWSEEKDNEQCSNGYNLSSIKLLKSPNKSIQIY